MANVSHHGERFQSFTYEECQAMNIAFARAMLRARRQNREHFVVGTFIDATAFNPTYFAPDVIHSSCGSAAQMCADEVATGVEGE